MALAYRRDGKTTEPRFLANVATGVHGELLQCVTESSETVVIERNGCEIAAIVPFGA